jgi:hypothetical protein
VCHFTRGRASRSLGSAITKSVVSRGSNMRRREFLRVIAGSVAVWPLAARAQQPAIPVIGFLHSARPSSYASMMAAFRKSGRARSARWLSARQRPGGLRLVHRPARASADRARPPRPQIGAGPAAKSGRSRSDGGSLAPPISHCNGAVRKLLPQYAFAPVEPESPLLISQEISRFLASLRAG